MCRLLAAVVALAVFLAVPSSAQGTAPGGAGAAVLPSCSGKLAPCSGYLNATASGPAPPASCCGPLKEAAANETACMCAILTNRAVLQVFGVEPAQGLLLAKRCGVATNASVCGKSTGAVAASPAGTAASSSSAGNAASAVTKPTASRGTTCRLSSIGMYCLIGISFVWSMSMT